jgi:hypothetical protein
METPEELYRFLKEKCSFTEEESREYSNMLREANFPTIDEIQIRFDDFNNHKFAMSAETQYKIVQAFYNNRCVKKEDSIDKALLKSEQNLSPLTLQNRLG